MWRSLKMIRNRARNFIFCSFSISERSGDKMVYEAMVYIVWPQWLKKHWVGCTPICDSHNDDSDPCWLIFKDLCQCHSVREGNYFNAVCFKFAFMLWTSPVLKTHNECNATVGLVQSWLSGPHLSWLSGPHLSWLSGPHLSWLSGPHLSWLSGPHSGHHPPPPPPPFLCSAVSMLNITYPYLFSWCHTAEDCSGYN